MKNTWPSGWNPNGVTNLTTIKSQSLCSKAKRWSFLSSIRSKVCNWLRKKRKTDRSSLNVEEAGKDKLIDSIKTSKAAVYPTCHQAQINEAIIFKIKNINEKHNVVNQNASLLNVTKANLVNSSRKMTFRILKSWGGSLPWWVVVSTCWSYLVSRQRQKFI